MKTAYAIMGAAAQDPRLMNVFTQFRINSPQMQMNIDRNKAKAIGISLTDIFDTLEVDLASLYVNNFTYLNRSWQVDVQADEPFRNRVSSLQSLLRQLRLGGKQFRRHDQSVRDAAAGQRDDEHERNGHRDDAAQRARADAASDTAPVITHYNLYRNIELNGNNAPGHGSGEAITAMEQIAQKVMPAGMSYEWSGLQLDEIAAGS